MTINRRSLFKLAVGAGSATLVGAVIQAQAKSKLRDGQGMTEQERNKQIVRDYFDHCFNRGDLEFGRGIIAEDYNFHFPLPPGAPKGFEAWKQGVGMFRVAFPDCHWQIHQLLAEADLISVRTVWIGTHSGPFMGVQASGRRVTAANSDYYRLHDGKFVEHWDVPDYLSILRQIGGSLDSSPPMFAGSIDP